MDKGTRLVKNTLILSIGTFATKVLSFVIVPLFSGVMSLSDFGQWDVFYTYITLLIPVAALSVGEGVFRYLLDTDTKEERTKIISSGLIVFIFGMILCCGCIVVFADFELKFYFLFLLIASSCYDILMYILRGLKQLKVYTISSIIYTVLMSAICLTLLYGFDFGIRGLYLGYGIAYVIAVGAACVAVNIFQYISIRQITKKIVGQLVKYSVPMIPNAISWWIANASDRTIISMVIGDEGNAIYAMANKIPAICTTMYSVFHLSWQQSASEEVGSSDFAVYINDVFSKVVVVLITISCCILSVNFILFEYIFDARYTESYYHVPILLSAVIFSMIASYMGGLFISLKKTVINGTTTMVAAVLNVVFNLLLIKEIGLYAASLSTLFSYIALFSIRYIKINTIYKISVKKSIWFYVLVYVYFVCMQYINSPIFNYINILLAGILFIYANRNLVRSLLNKILKRG